MNKVTRLHRLIVKITWFLLSFLVHLPMLYITILVSSLPYTCRLDFGDSFLSFQHLPEPSTSSCKAAWPLFKHHLHINAAKELVGRHLMWRSHLFEDICCPSPFLLLVQHPILSYDVTSKKVYDDTTLLLTSDPCCRDGFYPWTFIGLISYYFYFSLYSFSFNN